VEPSSQQPTPQTGSSSSQQQSAPRRPPAYQRSPAAQQHTDRYWLHALLFLATLASTVVVGGMMAGRTLLYGSDNLTALLTNRAFLMDGLRYSGALLGFLTVHEFGHYFAARSHRINTSLPYYIPFPLNIIGTLGAVISIREPLPDRRRLFDVGAAGPLAGFVVAFGVIVYAMATLPDPSYLLDQPGHEAIKEFIRQNGAYPNEILAMPEGENVVVPVVGNTLLFAMLKPFFGPMPPMYELLHYPVLFAGWLALFFTALNLLPVGQLDGGHITYALFGRKWHGHIARVFTTLLLVSGALGFVHNYLPELAGQSPTYGALGWFALAGVLYFFLSRVYKRDHRIVAPLLLGTLGLAVAARTVAEPLTRFGWTPWFFWAVLIVFLIKVDHPPVQREVSLTPRRRWLGYLAIVIFVLCFSFRPIYIL